MLHFLYELFDNSTNIPFYVGITENPNARFDSHVIGKNHSAKSSRVHARIQSLLAQGIETKMRILEVMESRRLVQAREKYRIALYAEQGVELLNVVHNGKRKENLPLPLLALMHSEYSLADSIIIPLTDKELAETEKQESHEQEIRIKKMRRPKPANIAQSQLTQKKRESTVPHSPGKNVFELYTDTIETIWQKLLKEEMRDHPNLASDTEVMLQLFVATFFWNKDPMEIEEKLLKDWARKKWQSLEHDDGDTWEYLEQESA